MSYGDLPSKPLPWKPLLLGIFLGWLITCNVMEHSYNYRISFYGYKQSGNQITPIIKLRKKLRAQNYPFQRADEGRDIEVGIMAVGQEGSSMEFDDAQVDALIRERYCRT